MLSKLNFFVTQIRFLFFKRRIVSKIQKTRIIKINVGASGKKYPGWFSFEKKVLDITNEKDWQRIFGNRKIDNILAEHVFEHLEYKDALVAFCNISRYLNSGGVFRFAVPDGNHPSEYVRNLTKPNGDETGSDDHKYFFTINDIPEIEKVTGLKAELIEYFDNNGRFIKNYMNPVRGHIDRCSSNYKGRFTNSIKEMDKLIDTTPNHLREQFFKNNLSYTSLIVDWTKEI